MIISFHKMNKVPGGSHYDASDQDIIPETTGQMEWLKPDGKPIKKRCPKRKNKLMT